MGSSARHLKVTPTAASRPPRSGRRGLCLLHSLRICSPSSRPLAQDEHRRHDNAVLGSESGLAPLDHAPVRSGGSRALNFQPGSLQALFPKEPRSLSWPSALLPALESSRRRWRGPWAAGWLNQGVTKGSRHTATGLLPTGLATLWVCSRSF